MTVTGFGFVSYLYIHVMSDWLYFILSVDRSQVEHLIQSATLCHSSHLSHTIETVSETSEFCSCWCKETLLNVLW